MNASSDFFTLNCSVPDSSQGWAQWIPGSLHEALAGCVAYAAQVGSTDLARVAALMGVSSPERLADWVAEGAMPLQLVRAFEHACGIGLVTRWLAATHEQFLIRLTPGVPQPAGTVDALEIQADHAMHLLRDAYAAQAGVEVMQRAAEALMFYLRLCIYHHSNLEQMVARASVPPSVPAAAEVCHAGGV